jgi:hypothetical protein
MKVLTAILIALVALAPACQARGHGGGGHYGGSHSGGYHSSGSHYSSSHSSGLHYGSSHHSSGRSFTSHYATGHTNSNVHYTHAYTRKNGTHVKGHWSSNPNSTRNDNFSTRGNVNPYTGEAGTKAPDGQ